MGQKYFWSTLLQRQAFSGHHETLNLAAYSRSTYLFHLIVGKISGVSLVVLAMATSIMLMPGDEVSGEMLPQSSNRTLTLGPGLRHELPATVIATRAGELCSDSRKNALWIEGNKGRYLPSVGDLVIAIVHHSSTETYHCSITANTPFALLGQLSFEGATKKTRPQLSPGALVYARVSKADKWNDVELECVSATSGKSDGLGPLKGGMLSDVSLDFARRLMMSGNKGGVNVLESIGEKIHFEVALGRNGKVWIGGSGVRETLAIIRVLKETDEKMLDLGGQGKLVKNVLKDL